ncbi:hypothetical protein IJI94_01735 [Candidatus Saccharibacteria bacterium]|nr:hypothetical protein [Candidatus Saccharibacteria bacterium]
MKTSNKASTKGEVIQLPNKVFNANWRDDIPEELKDEDEEMAFETYADEKNYESPENITDLAERKIRLRNARIGKKVGSLLRAA